jgi:hypothetical protein
MGATSDNMLAEPEQLIADLPKPNVTRRCSSRPRPPRCYGSSTHPLATSVFREMLQKATRLCDASSGIFWIFDGEFFASHCIARHSHARMLVFSSRTKTRSPIRSASYNARVRTIDNCAEPQFFCCRNRSSIEGLARFFQSCRMWVGEPPSANFTVVLGHSAQLSLPLTRARYWRPCGAVSAVVSPLLATVRGRAAEAALR